MTPEETRALIVPYQMEYEEATMSFEKTFKLYCPVINSGKRCSKEQLLDNVRSCMEFNGRHQGTVIGHDYASIRISAKQSRLQSARVCRIAEMFYDYAVEGIWPDPERVEEGGHVEDHISDLGYISGVSRVGYELFGDEGPLLIEKILGMTLVRNEIYARVAGAAIYEDYIIPEIEHFPLQYIALLAQMNEKAVRNATQPKAKDRLETIKVGAKTMVTHEEALRWLSNRRNFKPTVIPDSVRSQAH